MKLRNLLLCGAAAFAAASGSAQATTINLIDLGGVAGSPAEEGFKIAAGFWGSLFTNTATINLGVKFAPLPTNVIGSTGSRRADIAVKTWETRVNATKSSSYVDQNAVLPTLNGAGGFTTITQGVDGTGNNDTTVQVLDAGATTSTKVLYANSSLIKAIGGPLSQPTQLDGQVTFSSTFGFDFNPTDGISANTFDFIGVAIHEIGHALGFVSGVDFFDYYGEPKGPGAGALGYDLNDTSIFSALDMFRYSAPGVMDLTVGGTKYFSIDGGATALFGNTFSTGAYNGDGRQASHWKDTPGCAIGNGIMDPTFCFGQTGYITALDLDAFDAMGWNLGVDVHSDYLKSTGQLYNAYHGITSVPEPASWAMMIGGFALIGSTLRRRARTTVSFA